LATSLKGHNKDDSTPVWPVSEEVEIANLFVRMLFGDLELDQVVLGKYVRVVNVAMRMQSCKGLQSVFCSIVVTKPST
jgi:hypothetical protein